MGKKKGKKTKQDERGYSTTSSTAVVVTTTTTTTTTTPSNKPSSDVVEPEVVAGCRVKALNDPLQQQQQQQQKQQQKQQLDREEPRGSDIVDVQTVVPKTLSSTPSSSDLIPSKRLLKKIESLYDQLLQCKFTENQVDVVIKALSSSYTASPVVVGGATDRFSLESALDWFCLHLPVDELPSLFTDQREREAVAQEANPTSLQVERVTQEGGTNHHHIHFDESVHQHLLFDNNTQDSSTIHDDMEERDQKQWIIHQYGSEENDATSLQQTNEVKVQDHPSEQSSLSNQVDSLSPEELRLLKLEAQIEELHSSVNDEAANYMRSKHEIKDLQKELTKLRGQANKLRGKVAKIQAEKKQDEIIQDRNILESSEKNMKESDDDVICGLGLFDMTDEQDEGSTQRMNIQHNLDKEPTLDDERPNEDNDDDDDPFRFSSSEPSIPKGWTGATPKSLLGDWCKKQKIPRPTFIKLPQTSNGCRLTVKAKPNTFKLEQRGPFYSFADAQEYLSTQLLYQLNPELPMYRMLPPTFRDLWKDWLDGVAAAKNAIKKEDRDAKEKRLRELVELIPKNLWISEDPGTIEVGSEEETSVTPNPEPVVDWEEKNVQSSHSESQQPTSNLGTVLKDEFVQRRSTPAYMAMEKSRKQLPMYAYRDVLLEHIENNAVTVLCAETGGGKTTQGPQFMLEDALGRGIADKISILCTQPRRISAMSVADRVADEMCVKLGSLVGYQIRGEVVKSQRTKLLFCTTGVVLRKLQEDPLLSGITTVFVDEVHERSWQIDFLLVALRRLLSTTRPDLKVCLMSATLDAELFCSFFGSAPLINVPGRTFPVANYFLEDLLDATDHTIEEDSMYTLRDYHPAKTEDMWVTMQGGEKRRQVVDLDSQTDVSQVSGHYPDYKFTTQRSMDRVDEKVLNYDLIEDTLLLLATKENDIIVTPSGSTPSDGAVLIFLPGLGEIRTLSNRLNGSRIFGKQDKFTIVPLHSALSPQDQKRAFAPPRPGCRKIILSTNIAETSVTIPDVVCVIDCGLVREVRQDKRYATSKLVLDWCSKASIKQRAGRAGRVKEGCCCRLFSSRTATVFMKAQSAPELQRVPLEEVCLSILAGNLSDNCSDFLMQAPQPPPFDSISLALGVLTEVGAVQITPTGREILTPLGQHVAKIPVNVRLAKMLILGSIFRCLDPVLSIAGGLSGKSPFAMAFQDTTRASAAHRKFRHDTSDFMSLVQLWDAFRTELETCHDRGRGFCRRNYINYTVMMEIRDLRRQNLDLLMQIGFVEGKVSEDNLHRSRSYYNKYGSNEMVVHAVVCAGLYQNVAHVVKGGRIDDPPELWHKKERLFFHSSSVNHGTKKRLRSDWIVFHEKFSTGRTTLSTTAPVHPFMLVLFGGNVVVKHLERTILIDDWISLEMAAQTGVKFRELRQSLDALLLSLIKNVKTRTNDEDSNKKKNNNNNKMVDEIVQLLET